MKTLKDFVGIDCDATDYIKHAATHDELRAEAIELIKAIESARDIHGCEKCPLFNQCTDDRNQCNAADGLRFFVDEVDSDEK